MWIEIVFQITLMTLLGLCLWAAVSDYKAYRIPNIISLLMIGLYPIAVLTSPFHIEWYLGIFTCISVLVVGFFLYAAKLFGAGDVKMMAALSLWAGPYLMMPFLVATAVAGGALVILIVMRETLKNTQKEIGWIERVKMSAISRVAVPYGVAIAIGAGVIIWQYSAEGILIAQVGYLTGN
jgi:prepilin peptidase CpaA